MTAPLVAQHQVDVAQGDRGLAAQFVGPGQAIGSAAITVAAEAVGMALIVAGLAVLAPPAANAQHSYYLPSEKLLDPWGRRYLYLTPGPDGEPFELMSLGADGKQGGAGEDEDVTSARLRDEVPAP
jgi:general secretion pathway protein G